MTVRKVWRKTCRCDRCDAEWHSNKLENEGKLPVQCPYCHSNSWNEGVKKK